jgi:hypothetical protein
MRRTVEEQLYHELRDEYGFPRAINGSLRVLLYSYLNLYLGVDRTDGSLVFRAVPYDCPPGVRTEEIKTRPVRLTLISIEDVPVASRSISELTTNAQRFTVLTSKRNLVRSHHWRTALRLRGSKLSNTRLVSRSDSPR